MASTTTKLPACSLVRQSWIRNRRCRTGASRSHWGIALALGPNYNMPPIPEREEKAWAAIRKAVELSKTAPENERAYVNALVTRYSSDPNEDRKKLAVSYKDAMKTVMQRYPDDL